MYLSLLLLRSACECALKYNCCTTWKYSFTIQLSHYVCALQHNYCITWENLFVHLNIIIAQVGCIQSQYNYHVLFVDLNIIIASLGDICSVIAAASSRGGLSAPGCCGQRNKLDWDRGGCWHTYRCDKEERRSPAPCFFP